VSRGTKPRNVERVAIIGAGTMGGGIAMSFANAGIPVHADRDRREAAQARHGRDAEELRGDRRAGGIPADAPAKRMALINGVVGLENVKDADLVIEAVFRDHGDQEGSVREARSIRQAGRGSRQQHLLSQHR